MLTQPSLTQSAKHQAFLKASNEALAKQKPSTRQESQARMHKLYSKPQPTAASK
jgi:hypothetical protein